MIALLGALLLLLLACSAFFSGSETAFFSLDRLARGQLRRQGDPTSRRVVGLLGQPARLLSTILLGNTLVNVAGSAVAATLFGMVFLHGGVWWALAVETPLILLLGEILPKCLALSFSLPIARRSVTVLTGFSRVSAPLVNTATALADRLVTSTPADIEADHASREITAQELADLVNEVGEQGALSKQEIQLAARILAFARTTLQEVMTPWIDVEKVSLRSSRSEAEVKVRNSMHSRLPVFTEHEDDVVGYLTAKTYLANTGDEMTPHLRPVLVVPEHQRARDVLREMRARQRHMVVVVNEYGRPVGIVTAEDLVEEIVGEIYDEFELEEELVIETAPGRYRVSGQTPLDQVEERLGISLPPGEEDIVTLSGYLCHLIGEIPSVGVRVHQDGNTFVVTDVGKQRISWCEVRLGRGGGGGD